MSRKPLPLDIMGDVLNNASGAAVEVPLALIDDNPFQERSEYGDLADLASDIREHGLLQPPIVRPTPDGRYQLAFGHRRKRAVELAGLATLTVVVRALDDDRMATIAYSENDKRADVSAIDRARSIQRMIDRFGWTHQQVADKLSVARPTVSNLLRLLRAPENVQALVVAGSITERQVSALMPFYDLPEEAQERTKGQYYHIGEILRGAQTGTSSDILRKQVDSLVESSTRDMEGAPWAAVDLGIAGAQSVLCTTCPQRVVRNGKHRCPILACYQAKGSAWNGRALAEVVAATGIPAAPDRDHLKYNEYQQFYGDDRRIAQEHGFAKPPICDRLRVRNSTEGLQAEGAKDTEIICLHGANGKCGCLAKIRRELKKDGTARWKRIRAQTQEALTEALSAPTPDTLRLIAGHMASWDKRESVASWSIEDVVAAIVEALIKSAMPYDVEKRPDAGEKAMADLLARAFITPPWSLVARLAPEPEPSVRSTPQSLAEIWAPKPEQIGQDERRQQLWERVREHAVERTNPNGYIEPTVDREAPDYIDAKLQRIAGWIADFQDPGDGLPTPESVDGNFVNLEKLASSINALSSEADRTKLQQLHAAVYADLAALNDRVQQSYSTYSQ